ncbi:flagellar basal body P-ring formation protein FlgA [Marinobacter salinisoli]|uniref:Flagella basal body P-ring formation protein FlgA n=1 Tax=Marinobacter salinisoli TaxID=2769486 RepID=A0ABX7MP38_9GAMM|nr:flagellar basal body P-ring formation chaperone FlgA [Marinobacter salinisoli]QSP94033.1 flagellar basal body P-ring formation protein FlgA [Marinobacter salinisoli]
MRITKLSLTLLAFLIASPAHGKTSATEIQHAAQAFLERFALAQEEKGYSVTFATGSVDNRVALADCDRELAVDFTGDPWKSEHPSVQVACHGERPWRMFVTTKVSIQGPALVAARPLARGERLSRALVTTRTMTVNASRRGVLKDFSDVEGMNIRRAMNAGTLITPDMLSAPDAIQRGDHVVIVARSGNFSVRSRGKALSSGAIGEQIMVENLTSARTIRANVVAPGRVQVTM